MDQIFEEINDNLSDNRFTELVKNLEIITNKLKLEENRIILSENTNNWIILSKLLTRICNEINEQNDWILNQKLFLPLITELFRLLRNSLINCLANKRSIVTIGSIFDNSIHVFKHLIICYKNEENIDLVSKQQLIQSIKCCLQVLANLLSRLDQTNEDLSELRDRIWSIFAFDLFEDLLRFESDKSIGLISSMIFYSCIRYNNNNNKIGLNLLETTKSENLFQLFNIFELFLNQIETESSEWSLWSMQSMLKINNFLNCFYSKFQIKQKLIVLDLIYDLIDCKNQTKNESKIALNDSNLVYLCQLFKQSIGDVVKIDIICDDLNRTDENNLIAIHISKLLSILCELTTNQLYLTQLQTDRQLMECLTDTLKTIQLIGKTDGSSHFKAMPQLRQIDDSDRESLNPVFGFKRDIIRVIGNLVYKCPQMQDWVRELDGIPLVLDCCNIDAKNPYIMQWSVYTIRNIVDNNNANQELMSQLSRNGVLIDDQLTEKLGLKKMF